MAEAPTTPQTPPTAFTPEQRKVLTDWFQKHWNNYECPVCKSRKWVGADHVVQPMTQWPVGRLAQGTIPVYPVVLVTCTVCAYVIAFNAVVVGLVPSAAADSAKPGATHG